MLFKTIGKDELAALVRGFAESYEVLGPVERGGVFVFDEVGSNPSLLRVDYPTTVLPPKKYLMPPKQTLFEFDTAGNDVSSVPVHTAPRVLFGLHACDINGINRLDKVFMSGPYRDPSYEAQRKATMIVGISCMPTATCFCDIWGTGEVSAGYDLFLHDIGERYLVSILSVRAAEILATSTEAVDATEEDSALLRERTHRFASAFGDSPSTDGLSLSMDAFYGDEALWERIGGKCLSCCACSTVCPTCHCFDIVDRLEADGTSGQRVREWDSCNSPASALVTGGHNFRPTPASRVRNRFYHKFVGYPSRYDSVMCVGCGRCTIACKAHINPRSVLLALQSVGDAEGEE